MKKTVCGVLVTVIGLVFSVVCLVYAMQHPWNYKGIDGLMGSLLGTKMLIPLILSFIVMLSGLVYCFWSAYQKDE